MLICQLGYCICHNDRNESLKYSIRHGNNQEAKELLRKNPNLYLSTDNSGSTLLHSSVQHGNVEMVKHLIRIGCNINAQDASGFTPLILAVQLEDLAIIELLLENKANISIITLYGDSVLDAACRRCICRKSPLSSNINTRLILKTFFEKLSSDYTTEKMTVTRILLNASEMVKLSAVVFGSIELLRFMLRHNYAINYEVPSTGHTALHCAIIFAKLGNAEILIKHGAKINTKDLSRHSPLHYYIYNSQNEDENSKVLKLLLKYSNNLTEPGANGISEIERLILFGNKQTVKTVLQSGIDVARINFSGGRSLQHLLIKNENADVGGLLSEYIVDFDVNAKLSNGATALMKAVKFGTFREVEMLLKLGADANYTTWTGESVFHSTLCNSRKKDDKDTARIIGILLQYGADVQRICDSEKSILSDSYILWKEELSIQVIVAHLALINTLDESTLTDNTRLELKSKPILYANFDLCMNKLKQLKSVYVFKNITLFKLLSEKEGKILAYFRNPEFVSAFKSVITDKLPNLALYYIFILQRRLEQALNISRLQEKIETSFELLTGLCGNTFYSIMYEIISHLNLKDVNNLCRVESMFL